MKRGNIDIKISLDHEPVIEGKNKTLIELKDLFKKLERKLK